MGKIFLILPEFINMAPSSCRATLFYFLPFFRLAYLGECRGYPSFVLIPMCPIFPYMHLIPLDFSYSLRSKRYWMRSSCSADTLSTPYLFHCSSMFGRSIPFLSTMSLISGSFVPTSLNVISESPSTSYIGVLASLFPPSIGLALPPCSPLLLGFSVFSWVSCSLASLAFIFSFNPSSSWLGLPLPSILILSFRLLPVGALPCLLFP